MNESEYTYLKNRIAAQIGRNVDAIAGTILLDFAIIPKRSLYPALAELLGVECECRTIECLGCDEVEEWLAGLEDPEEMLSAIANATGEPS
jgi:hypothetical protein